MSTIFNGGVVQGPSGVGPQPAITYTVTNVGATVLNVGDLVAFDVDEASTSGFALGVSSGVFSAVKRTTSATSQKFYHAVVTKAPEGGAAEGDSLEVFVGPGFVTMAVSTFRETPAAISDGDPLFTLTNRLGGLDESTELPSGYVQVATYRDADFTPSDTEVFELKTVYFDGSGEAFGRSVST